MCFGRPLTSAATPARGKRRAQSLDGVGHEGLALAPPLLELPRQFAIGVRPQEAEGEVLQLPLQLPQTQPVRQRRQHVQRLLADAGLGRVPLARVPAQRLQARGQPQQDDADVGRHRQQHPPQGLDLLAGGGFGSAPVQFAQPQDLPHAVDQQRHVGTELAFDLRAGNAIRLGEQRGRHLAGLVGHDLGQDRDRALGVPDERLATATDLARQSLAGQGQRALDRTTRPLRGNLVDDVDDATLLGSNYKKRRPIEGAPPVMLQRLFNRKRQIIDDAVWDRVLSQVPFVGHLAAADLTRLREACEAFLSSKQISGAAGFEPDAVVRASLAVQACLPALNLGLQVYADFVEIIVYPGQFLVPRRRTDEVGVVHEAIEVLAGEAMDGGPIVLSWEDAGAAGAGGSNVTIHEFVHKIDLLDGEADGIPPLPSARRRRWQRALDDAYEAFCDALEHAEQSVPRHLDPESEEADEFFADLPMDPYAATDPAEFFAVSGEVFFVAPEALRAAFPAWYGELAELFGQDPAGGVSQR